MIRAVSILAFLSFALLSPAAYVVPPHLEDAPMEEQMRIQQWEGENSLREKRSVGRARYESRKAYRESVLVGMRERAATRLEDAQAVPQHVSASRSSKPGMSFWAQSALAGLAAVALLFFVQARHRECA